MMLTTDDYWTPYNFHPSSIIQTIPKIASMETLKTPTSGPRICVRCRHPFFRTLYNLYQLSIRPLSLERLLICFSSIHASSSTTSRPTYSKPFEPTIITKPSITSKSTYPNSFPKHFEPIVIQNSSIPAPSSITSKSTYPNSFPKPIEHPTIIMKPSTPMAVPPSNSASTSSSTTATPLLNGISKSVVAASKYDDRKLEQVKEIVGAELFAMFSEMHTEGLAHVVSPQELQEIIRQHGLERMFSLVKLKNFLSYFPNSFHIITGLLFKFRVSPLSSFSRRELDCHQI